MGLIVENVQSAISFSRKGIDITTSDETNYKPYLKYNGSQIALATSQAGHSNGSYNFAYNLNKDSKVTLSAINSTNPNFSDDLSTYTTDSVTGSEVTKTNIEIDVDQINIRAMSSSASSVITLTPTSALLNGKQIATVDSIGGGVSTITNTSQLVNDSGFITADDLNSLNLSVDKNINDLTYYYTKTETDTLLNNLTDQLLGEGAHEDLNTISELSAALQNNKDIITTLNQAIGAKAAKTDIHSLTIYTANDDSYVASADGTFTPGTTVVESIYNPLSSTESSVSNKVFITRDIFNILIASYNNLVARVKVLEEQLASIPASTNLEEVATIATTALQPEDTASVDEVESLFE